MLSHSIRCRKRAPPPPSVYPLPPPPSPCRRYQAHSLLGGSIVGRRRLCPSRRWPRCSLGKDDRHCGFCRTHCIEGRQGKCQPQQPTRVVLGEGTEDIRFGHGQLCSRRRWQEVSRLRATNADSQWGADARNDRRRPRSGAGPFRHRQRSDGRQPSDAICKQKTELDQLSHAPRTPHGQWSSHERIISSE